MIYHFDYVALLEAVANAQAHMLSEPQATPAWIETTDAPIMPPSDDNLPDKTEDTE